MTRRSGTGLAILALSCGCTTAGPREVALRLEVAGVALEAPFEGRDGWQIALERADVAFGPLYLCSGGQAGELCDTARAEWLESVVVDGLDPEPRVAGVLAGTSGPVRSWMYDHAITSLLTQPQPLVLAASEALGGSSVVLAGTAERDGITADFFAEIAIQQEEETERGVPVVRKSTSDSFEHELTGSERALVVRFDPKSWLRGVDFSAAVAEGVTDVSFEPDSQGFRSIRNDVVAGPRPTFTWRQ